MPATAISIGQAKTEKLFYVVANVIVVRPSDKRCLILKRGPDVETHPNKWCVPGGRLEWSDLDVTKPTRHNGDVLDFENIIEILLQREVHEETGLKIKQPLYYVNSVGYVRPDGVPSVLVKFTAVCQSGDVELEKEFSDYAWVNADEVKKYDCILGVAAEISQAARLVE